MTELPPDSSCDEYSSVKQSLPVTFAIRSSNSPQQKKTPAQPWNAFAFRAQSNALSRAGADAALIVHLLLLPGYRQPIPHGFRSTCCIRSKSGLRFFVIRPSWHVLFNSGRLRSRSSRYRRSCWYQPSPGPTAWLSRFLASHLLCQHLGTCRTMFEKRHDAELSSVGKSLLYYAFPSHLCSSPNHFPFPFFPTSIPSLYF